MDSSAEDEQSLDSSIGESTVLSDTCLLNSTCSSLMVGRHSTLESQCHSLEL